MEGTPRPIIVLRALSVGYTILALLLASSVADILLFLPALLYPLWSFFSNSQPFTLVMLCICESEEEALDIQEKITADFDVMITVEAGKLIEGWDDEP